MWTASWRRENRIEQSRTMTSPAAHPFDAFVLSLDQDDASAFATPMLQAIWLGLRGDWHAAHELAQQQHGADGAWVHAWLHRIEGDLGNADYWYRRARRPLRRDDTRAEGLEIARALIESIERGGGDVAPPGAASRPA
jgi:hypothetical protein